MANIFISHSSKDNDITKEIFEDLKDINRSIFLDFDGDHKLQGGDKWAKELYKRVKKARIMIVVLSPNWLDSTWCYKEYCMARVLRKKVIPVIIKEDNRIQKWDGSDLQHFDFTKDEEEKEKLKSRIKDLTFEDVTKLYDIKTKSPYVELRSFNKDEAGLFFGRTKEILDGVDELEALLDSQKRFLNIIGASGVGKSSFLKAGILPFVELLHQDKWFVLPTYRAKESLLDNFVKTLSYYSDKSLTDIKKALVGDEFKTFIDEVELNIYENLREKKQNIQDIKLLFPIDQAEEVFNSSKEEKRVFFEIVKYMLTKKSFYLVWTIRADHLNRYQQEKELEFLQQLSKEFVLNPISSKEIKNIISEPALTADILVDEEVIEEIRGDISSSLSLPILSYLLETLYKSIQDKNQKKITINDYKALSKTDKKTPIEDIINQSANKIYNQKDEKLFKDLFLNHLIKVSIDESITKKSAKLSSLSKPMQEMAEMFVLERLFVKDKDDKDEVVIEIAHEALIDSWDELKSWITHEKEYLLFKAHFEILYKEWIAKNKTKKALLTGLNLENALKYKNRLNKNEQEFIRVSKRREFIRKFSFISLVVAVVGISLFSAIYIDSLYKKAVIARDEAESARDEAEKLVQANIFDIQDKLLKRGIDLSIIKDSLEAVGRYYEKLGVKDEPNIRRRVAVYYANMGDFYKKAGDIKKAKEFYQKALEIFKELVKRDPIYKDDLAISYGKMGDTFIRVGDLSKAKDFFMIDRSIPLLKSLS